MEERVERRWEQAETLLSGRLRRPNHRRHGRQVANGSRRRQGVDEASRQRVRLRVVANDVQTTLYANRRYSCRQRTAVAETTNENESTKKWPFCPVY